MTTRLSWVWMMRWLGLCRLGGGRLPTPKEWKWAAVAGTGFRFPRGNAPINIERANVDFRNIRA
jgi:hypothetical protein